MDTIRDCCFKSQEDCEKRKSQNIDQFSNFPAYHCLSISHNEHKCTCISINEYLNEEHIKDTITYEEAQKCLETDSIWELRIYPRTQISFYTTIASTLLVALEMMMMNCKDGEWI